jgi:hypothetical protein
VQARIYRIVRSHGLWLESQGSVPVPQRGQANPAPKVLPMQAHRVC